MTEQHKGLQTSHSKAEREQAERFASLIQANLGRASRYSNQKPKNWSLYFFFKLVSDQQEQGLQEKTQKNRSGLESSDSEDTDIDLHSKAILEELGSGDIQAAGEDSLKNRHLTDAPRLTRFRNWLARLSTDDGASSLEDPGSPLEAIANSAPKTGHDGQSDDTGKKAKFPPLDTDTIVNDLLEVFDEPDKISNVLFGLYQELSKRKDQAPVQFLIEIARISGSLYAVLKDKDEVRNILELVARDGGQEKASQRIFAGGLPAICIYELLRQSAGQVLKSEAKVASGDDAEKLPFDPVPINLAFTHPGLEALGVHETTLASFPDVFKEGMAARADRLGDTGENSPENWEGALGQRYVHGYFSGGFRVGNVAEDQWESLRQQIEEFNSQTGAGPLWRLLVNTLFRAVGLEILHIELGQYPYDKETGFSDGPRFEHFGFRDGISQPFKDMRLGDVPDGGGTPRPDGTWGPVAKGEIYLGLKDEDGDAHLQPFHPVLREGGTFLVFRKLEQDVAGFRTFLEEARPGKKPEQEKLAAQMMGRWRNGTALVLFPNKDKSKKPEDNDFRYVADDPKGEKCPLSAHIRRANPRDIGDGQVRRHRILRRSISYGGPFLPEGAKDDRKRGLLFIAANSRIDLQFEVLQANWINGGEFLGQAGLDKCPVVGSNNAGIDDRFIVPGNAVPVTNIPRFVTTRGGDYFFAPSVEALKQISRREVFEPDPDELTYDGRAMADIDIRDPFDRDRLVEYKDRIFAGEDVAIRWKMEDPGGDRFGSDLVFVARHQDVIDVMRGDKQGQEVYFSANHYKHASQYFLEGEPMIIGTDPGADTGALRDRLHYILKAAWSALAASIDVHNEIERIVKETVEAELKAANKKKKIDLVKDLATKSSYAMLRDFFGVPGPSELSNITKSIPFRTLGLNDVPEEWLDRLEDVPDDERGMITLQTWGILQVRALIGNTTADTRTLEFAKVAAKEMVDYLSALWDETAASFKGKPQTFLEAFISVQKDIVKKYKDEGYTAARYKQDALILLVELVGTPISVIPLTFRSVMSLVLKHGIGLAGIAPFLERDAGDTELSKLWGDRAGYIRFVYEAERLNSNFPIMFRRAQCDHKIREFPIKKGDWLVSIIQAANVEPLPDRKLPETFSLHPYLPGEPRPLKNYLLFGIPGGEHECWGRDKIALKVLAECLKGAAKLKGLRGFAAAAKSERIPPGIQLNLGANFTEL